MKRKDIETYALERIGKDFAFMVHWNWDPQPTLRAEIKHRYPFLTDQEIDAGVNFCSYLFPPYFKMGIIHPTGRELTETTKDMLELKADDLYSVRRLRERIYLAYWKNDQKRF